VRVALADDSALFRNGLALLLTTAGVEITAQARTGDELLTRIASGPPEVVVLDIRMPPTFTDEGLTTAEEVRARHPGVGVLVLSVYGETPYALRLLKGGPRGIGYLLKDRVDDLQTLMDALTRVAAGESVIDQSIVARLLDRQQRISVLDPLTARERDVLRLMAEGRSNHGIAQQLHLSLKTIEAHAASLFTKLGLPSAPDDNRRVLAVLTWLRADSQPHSTLGAGGPGSS
jgi:DNA-binding NarL/FixJ family response regulator